MEVVAPPPIVPASVTATPEQTLYGPAALAVGAAEIVTEKAFPALTQPEVVFATVNVPVYVAAAAPAGTTSVTGEAFKVALFILVNPPASAAAL